MVQKRGNESTIEEVILRNTGYDSIEEFTNPNKDYFIKDLDKVAARIKIAIENNVPITVVGDYDVDGVTASSIMYMTLKRLGADVKVRIPYRFSEGFGLSEKIIDEIDKGLLITVDNGIAALSAVQKAKDKGLEVIVTDHHEPVFENGIKTLPNADLIIDPHAIDGQAQFDGYCGAGLAYKLSSILVEDEIFNDKMSCFAALGTVSDVMKLVEENKLIVKKGLSNMTKEGHRTDGLRGILSRQYCDKFLTETDIGFKIGPMINAAGRLIDDGAKKPFEVMTTDNLKYQNFHIADELFELNNKRKQIVEKSLPEFEKEIVEKHMENDFPLVLYKENIPEGVIGIIAGKLAEKYDKPALIFSDSEDPAIMKGSGRTGSGVNLKELLDMSPEQFYKYGGHAEAAGISILKSNFENAKNALQKNCKVPLGYVKDTNTYYDVEIDADDLEKNYKIIEKYGPYGEGNQKVSFKVKNFELTEVEQRDGSLSAISFMGGGKYTKLYGQNGIAAFGESKTLVSCMADSLLFDVEKECHGAGIKASTFDKLKYLMYYYTEGFTKKDKLQNLFDRINPNEDFKNFVNKKFDEMILLPSARQKDYKISNMLSKNPMPKKINIVGTLSVSYFKEEFTYQVDIEKAYDPEKVLEKEQEIVSFKSNDEISFR